MKKINGFTLIELIVFITLLGCVAAVVAPMVSDDFELKASECPVTIGEAEYITSLDHCEALRLYIESTIAR